MERSESIKHLAAALNKAQAEMSGAKKDKTNPFFKSSYADLNAVVDAVRIPFAENGLSYSQFPLMDDSRVGVETILMHESGEFIASKLMLPTGKLDAQAAGSAITYARRYSLQAIAGIPAEDDDGNGATGNVNHKSGNQLRSKNKQAQNITKQQVVALGSLIEGKGYQIQQATELWKINSLEEIQAQNYQSFVDNVNSWGGASAS